MLVYLSKKVSQYIERKWSERGRLFKFWRATVTKMLGAVKDGGDDLLYLPRNKHPHPHRSPSRTRSNSTA